jgi:hypothetical protein
MSFTVQKYRLEFAIWAAYKAAQAGSSKAKGVEFSEALKECGVVLYINKYVKEEVDANTFKEKHDEWCEAVIKHIKKKYGKEITYGIAAKLIGIFIKGYFILESNEDHPLAKVAHPPIDSFLLKGIDKSKGTKLGKEYKWQKLDKEKYYELLAKLKGLLENDEGFWCIEKYWKLS